MPRMLFETMDKLNDQEAYNELTYYTLEHALRDKSFIHQYVVDAYAAQHANKSSKPVYIAFALAGLYLHIEKGYTGKQVQEAHMQLAKSKTALPSFSIPSHKAAIDIHQILKSAPGVKRDQTINKWSLAVWQMWKESHPKVISWIKSELGV